MNRKNDFFENAFKTLQEEGLPTESQKASILKNVLANAQENDSILMRIKQFVASYPWRTAFAASTLQAVVFTLIFGTRYTNLFLSFFGG